MIITSFRSSYTRELPWNIIYRNHKNFNAQDFLSDLETNLKLEEQASMCVSYDKLTKVFKETTDKHAPQKKQKIWGNQAQLVQESNWKNNCLQEWSFIKLKLRPNFLYGI